MSVDVAEASQPVSSAETDVCVGDGTTCVECGKVFTHPFYFSTHISTHTSEKEFVVVGQCALCGLVFSDPVTFSAHMNSSQKRLELDTQVTPEVDQNETVRPGKKVPKGRAARVGQVERNGVPGPSEVTIKEEIMDDMQPNNNDPVVEPSENAAGVNGDAKNKRKRRAPQRFEVEHTSPPVSSSDVDPAVEAYLLSLKQMGLTVDPEAFSSPKGSKRIRRSSEGGRGRGRGRGRKMLGFAIDPMEMNIKTEDSLTKKASPKYEYDSDSSFDETEIEILPQSGKMTRGQRLQQRLERLSQLKDDDNHQVKSSKESEVENEQKAENGSNGASDQTEQTENGSQADAPATSSPGVQVTGSSKIKKPEKIGLVTQKRVSAQSSTPMKPTPLGEILGAGSLLAQNVSRFHSPRPRAAARSAGNYGQVTPVIMSPNPGPVFTPRGPAINNIRPRGLGTPQVRGRGSRGGRGGIVRTTGPQDLLLNNSLEDLKRNSRDNVQHMLQNVGMMAVTSSLEQGKQTATRGGVSPLPRGRGARGVNQARFRQSSQFNSPQPMASGVVSRDVPNRFNVPTAGVVNRYPRGRGRQATNSVAASSTPQPGGCTTHPGSCGHGRGHHHHHHHHHHSGQGTSGQPGSAPGAANRGMRRPCPIHGYRRLLNSNEIIVIDDDDVVEVQPTEVINADDDDDVQEIRADSSSGKSADDLSELNQTNAHCDGGEGTIMTLDLEVDFSTTKSSGETDMTDEGQNETSSDTLERDSEVADQMTEPQVGRRKRRKMDFPVRIVDKRRDSEENQDKKRTDDTDISQGEDIDGWKVCLAENSDSNLSQPSTPAAAAVSDLQEFTAQSEQDNPVSSPPIVEKSANDDSALQNSATSPKSKPSKVGTDAVENIVDSELLSNVSSQFEERLEHTVAPQNEDACLDINQTNINTETEERSPIAADDEAEAKQFQDVQISESFVSLGPDSSDKKNITDNIVEKPSSDMDECIDQEKSETVSQSGLITNSDMVEPCSTDHGPAIERLENSALPEISQHPEPGIPASRLSVDSHGNLPDQEESVNHEVNSFQFTDASQRSPCLVTVAGSCDPSQTVSQFTATVEDNVKVPTLDNSAETTNHTEEDNVVLTSVDSHVSSNEFTDCNDSGENLDQEHLFGGSSKKVAAPSLEELAGLSDTTAQNAERREQAGVSADDDLVSLNQSDNSVDITFHVGTFLQAPTDSQLVLDKRDTGLADSTAGETDTETCGRGGHRVSPDQAEAVHFGGLLEGQVLPWNSSTLVKASEKLDGETSPSSECLTQCNDSVVDVFSEIQKACQQIEDVSSGQVEHSSGDQQIEDVSSGQVEHGCGDQQIEELSSDQLKHSYEVQQIEDLSSGQVEHGCEDGKDPDGSHLQVLEQDGTESQADSEELTVKEDVLSETQGSSMGSNNTESASHT